MVFGFIPRATAVVHDWLQGSPEGATYPRPLEQYTPVGLNACQQLVLAVYVVSFPLGLGGMRLVAFYC